MTQKKSSRTTTRTTKHDFYGRTAALLASFAPEPELSDLCLFPHPNDSPINLGLFQSYGRIVGGDVPGRIRPNTGIVPADLHARTELPRLCGTFEHPTIPGGSTRFEIFADYTAHERTRPITWLELVEPGRPGVRTVCHCWSSGQWEVIHARGEKPGQNDMCVPLRTGTVRIQERSNKVLGDSETRVRGIFDNGRQPLEHVVSIAANGWLYDALEGYLDTQVRVPVLATLNHAQTQRRREGPAHAAKHPRPGRKSPWQYIGEHILNRSSDLAERILSGLSWRRDYIAALVEWQWDNPSDPLVVPGKGQVESVDILQGGLETDAGPPNNPDSSWFADTRLRLRIGGQINDVSAETATANAKKALGSRKTLTR